jgi:RimJ/RimL family protein N-acetyltransferase
MRRRPRRSTDSQDVFSLTRAAVGRATRVVRASSSTLVQARILPPTTELTYPWLPPKRQSAHPPQQAYRLDVELRAEGGLLLRQPRAGDLDAVVKACSDPDIPRFIPFIPVPYAREDAEAWLQLVTRAWGESDERTFAIIDEERDPQLQGVVTVRLREDGTVGYWLAPWARGRGVMTASVHAIVEWACAVQGVSRLLLTAHPDNVASQRVAERTGFTRVGMTDHQPPFRDGLTTAVLFEFRRHS